jgi:mRNA interferase RelE/StbE
MAYRVEIKKSARKQYEKLPSTQRRQVADAIDKLSANPRHDGVIKLTNAENRYRARVGNYRIVFCIFDREVVVFIVAIDNRKDIYRKR